jgi:hypothetical protein
MRPEGTNELWLRLGGRERIEESDRMEKFRQPTWEHRLSVISWEKDQTVKRATIAFVQMLWEPHLAG